MTTKLQQQTTTLAGPRFYLSNLMVFGKYITFVRVKVIGRDTGGTTIIFIKKQ